MIQFAHILDRVAHPLQPFLWLVAVGAWVFAVASQISAYRARTHPSARPTSRKAIAGIVVFVAVIGAEFALAGAPRHAALVEIKSKLYSNIDAITINGTKLEDNNALLAALRGMRDTAAHHSSPTTIYRLVLDSANGPLELCLRRDSQDPHEYWIFYPDFYSTEINSVGRVFTDALDGSKSW